MHSTGARAVVGARAAVGVLFWLAVLYIFVRLTLADSKAVLLAYYASLRLFSCSYVDH
jgi:hypothetical protein